MQLYVGGGSSLDESLCASITHKGTDPRLPDSLAWRAQAVAERVYRGRTGSAGGRRGAPAVHSRRGGERGKVRRGHSRGGEAGRGRQMAHRWGLGNRRRLWLRPDTYDRPTGAPPIRHDAVDRLPWARGDSGPTGVVLAGHGEWIRGQPAEVRGVGHLTRVRDGSGGWAPGTTPPPGKKSTGL